MRKQKRTFIAGMLLALVLGSGLSLTEAAETAPDGTQILYNSPDDKPLATETKEQAPAQTEDQMKISINLAARSLALFRGDERIALYPIGPGTPSTPTPTGYYKIQEKEVNPTWVSPENPKVVIRSGPDCPIGYRWMTLQGHYGIHGTNKPESIGEYVSNGCVRMLEDDVEALFDKVQVGTPVEITYNRIVVEKAPDDQIVYYIYPDGYGWQKIDVADVRSWLKGYGVQDFVTDTEIEEKIAASDGEPTYIAKVYPLTVNGKKLEGKAVEQAGKIYLPALQLAETTKISLGWNASTERLISSESVAVGYDKEDTLYCEPQAAARLFHLQGGLTKDGTYALQTADYQSTVASPTAATTPVTSATAAQSSIVKDTTKAAPAQSTKSQTTQRQRATKAATNKKVAGKKHVKTLAEIEAEATKQG